MSRNYTYGGKIGKPKSLKQIGREISRGTDKAFDALGTAGAKLGQFTNKELLPAITTIGMPIASTALGALGEEFGGPLGGMAAESLSSNLMKQYIPKQYQSKNKYIQTLGDTISMAGKTALTGEADPEAMMGIASNLIPTGKRSARQNYNPDNPYQDLLQQYMSGFPDMIPTEEITPDNQPSQQKSSVSDEQEGIYSSGDIDENADSVIIKSSPYQQREGSTSGLLGSGIKRKKKKTKGEKIIKVEMIEKLPHQKFSHAKNTALDQLLSATKEKEEKQSKQDMRDMMKMQMDLLEDLGYEKPKRGRGRKN